MKALYGALVTCLVLCLARGCSLAPRSKDRESQLVVISRISGEWGIPSGGTYVQAFLEGGKVVEKKTTVSEPLLVMIFNQDGSLDLSRTMYAGLPDFKPLRVPGDRIEYSGGSKEGYIEVDNSCYLPESSELTLLDVNMARHVRTKIVYTARLRSDGTLEYEQRHSDLNGSYMKGVLHRFQPEGQNVAR